MFIQPPSIYSDLSFAQALAKAKPGQVLHSQKRGISYLVAKDGLQVAVIYLNGPETTIGTPTEGVPDWIVCNVSIKLERQL